MIKIDLNAIVERNAIEFISTQLGDDIVLMNTNNGDYIGMNAVGADIWKLLITPLSLNEIVNRVVNLYEVDEQYGKDKVISFLELMLERKVILGYQPNHNSKYNGF